MVIQKLFHMSPFMKAVYLFWIIAGVSICVILWDEHTGNAVHRDNQFLINGETQQFFGFWGEPTANIDWCETNYAVTPYLAEFWNSVSAFAFILGSIFGLSTIPDQWREKKLMAVFVSIWCVGWGTLMFHATLTRETQLLDEIPMTYAALCCIFLINSISDTTLSKRTRTLKSFELHLLVGLAIIATCAQLVLPSVPQLFQAMFTLMVLYIVVRATQMYQEFGHLTQANILLQGSMISFISGVLVWALEPRVCNTLGWLNLHAWWHLLSCLGAYLLVMYCVYLRLYVLGHKPTVQLNVLPVIVIQ